jgi:exonuclease III
MTEKPLTLISLNVKGLGRNSSKQKKIKTWVASLPSPPQILLLQEHHMEESDLTSSIKEIEFWNNSSFWNSSIPMGRSQRTNAGIAILVDRMIAPLIRDNGILLECKA